MKNTTKEKKKLLFECRHCEETFYENQLECDEGTNYALECPKCGSQFFSILNEEKKKRGIIDDD